MINFGPTYGTDAAAAAQVRTSEGAIPSNHGYVWTFGWFLIFRLSLGFYSA